MPKLRFNLELLKETAERDGCTINYEAIVDRINSVLLVKFTCKCGGHGEKKFERLCASGGFCRKCSTRKRFEKAKVTNLAKYGVEFTWQSVDVKDKIKQTNLNRYGVHDVHVLRVW